MGQVSICSEIDPTSLVPEINIPLNFDIKCILVGNKTVESLRCSWSIACPRCSNCIFILDFTPGFNGLGKDSCKTKRETFRFQYLVQLMVEVRRYTSQMRECCWLSYHNAICPLLMHWKLCDIAQSQWHSDSRYPGLDHPGCGLNSVISYWLSPYPEWSLHDVTQSYQLPQ